MNTLGIDFGQKRLGLAWRQEGIDIVFPYGVLEVSSLEDTKKKLQDFIKEEHIDKIVFGLPFELEGKKENERTEMIRALGAELAEECNIVCDFFDERFTTHQASRREGDASIDEKSAMIILESYFEARGE